MIFQHTNSYGKSFDGPKWAAEYLMRTGIPKTARVVDIAAGTGLVVEILREKYGFTGIADGVDGSQGMLDKAKERGIYNQLICSKLGDGSVMPLENGM